MSTNTIFNVYGAELNANRTITYPATLPSFIGQRDKSKLPVGFANCDFCGSKLVFSIYPDMAINLPWEPDGWLLQWDGDAAISVRCGECRNKKKCQECGSIVAV